MTGGTHKSASTRSGKPDTQRSRLTTASSASKETARKKEIGFEAWVLKKDKYDKAVSLLQSLDVDRASNDDQWEQITRCLAAVDCYMVGAIRLSELPRDKDEEADLDGELASDEDEDELRTRKRSGKASGSRQNDAGQTDVLGINSKTSCNEKLNVKPLRGHWLRWTMQHKTFHDVEISEQEFYQFDAGSRENMKIIDSEDGKGKRYICPSVKIIRAAKKSKDDNAKIALRKALTKDEKLRNKLFVRLCRNAWKEAREAVLQSVHEQVEKLFASASSPSRQPRDKKGKISDESKENINAQKRRKALKLLNEMGNPKLVLMIEEDKEQQEKKAKESQMEAEKEASSMHESFAKRKDELRLRMPQGEELQRLLRCMRKPGRMDFSGSRKGRAKPPQAQIAASSFELMLGSGLKYIHAQAGGKDLERSRKQLLREGLLYKENFKGEEEQYFFEKKNRTGDGGQNEDEDRKQKFLQWAEVKEMTDKAQAYLKYIATPVEKRDEAMKEREDEEEDVEEDYFVHDHWEEVGMALKGVDTSLLTLWMNWSKGYKTVAECKKCWEGYEPQGVEGEATLREIKDSLLQQVRPRGINLREEFFLACKRRAEVASRRGDGEELQIKNMDDLPEEFRSISKAEFERILQRVKVKVRSEALAQLVSFFDKNQDGKIDLKELDHFLDPKAAFLKVSTEWSMKKRQTYLGVLKALSSAKREEERVRTLISSGKPPGPPELLKGLVEDGDPTSELFLYWKPPKVAGNNVASFYVLETSGVEGSKSQLSNDFKEVCRDPKDFDDNGGEPRCYFRVSGLNPASSYVFRLRAVNGFGAGPWIQGTFTTAPAAPPQPLLVRVTTDSITLRWRSDQAYAGKIRRLKQLFQEADVDGNGTISRDELMNELERRHPKLVAFLQRTMVKGVTSSTGAPLSLSVFEAIDTDDRESISWEEFALFFQGLDLDDETAQDLGISPVPGSKESRGSSFSSSSSSSSSSGKSVGKASKVRYILKQCLSDAASEYVEVYRGSKVQVALHGLKSGTSYQYRVQAMGPDGQLSLHSDLHSDPVIVHTRLQTPEAPTVVSGSVTATSVKLRWPEMTASPPLKSGSESRKGARQKEQVDKLLKEWTKAKQEEDEGLDVLRKFDEYDRDGSGLLDLPEFKAVLEDLAVDPSPEVLAEYFEEFDQDKNGKISREEFAAWWNKPHVTYILKRDDGISEEKLTQLGSSLRRSLASSYPHVCYRGRGRVVEVHGLQPNTLYHFKLRAVGSFSTSDLGKELQIMTAPSPPTPPAIVDLGARSVSMKFYSGDGGAFRFLVQLRFLETLPSSAQPQSRGTPNASLTGRQSDPYGDWKTAYDGGDGFCTITGLLPNSVYRVRVQCVNRQQIASEFSEVAQFATKLPDRETTLKPSNVSSTFTMELHSPLEAVVGDAILFQERLIRHKVSGKIVEETYRRGTAGAGTSQSLDISTSLTLSIGSNSGDFVGKRTIAARVLSAGSLGVGALNVQLRLVVIWATVVEEMDDQTQLLSARGRAKAKQSNPRDNISQAKLVPGATILRDARMMTRYEMFRTRWLQEDGRGEELWKKKLRLNGNPQLSVIE